MCFGLDLRRTSKESWEIVYNICAINVGDLWGPLLLCMLLSMYFDLCYINSRTLGMNSVQGADTIFGTVFIIMWGGATVITFIICVYLKSQRQTIGRKCFLFPEHLCVGVLCVSHQRVRHHHSLLVAFDFLLHQNNTSCSRLRLVINM